MKLGQKRKGQNTYLKVIMAKTFSNLRREMHIHIHEAQRITNKINPKEDYMETHYNKFSNLRTETIFFKKREKIDSSYII